MHKMITEINETKKILEKLKLEGKVEALDKPEDIKVMIEMNNIARRIHEDYLAKSAGSTIRAKDCWVYYHSI